MNTHNDPCNSNSSEVEASSNLHIVTFTPHLLNSPFTINSYVSDFKQANNSLMKVNQKI